MVFILYRPSVPLTRQSLIANVIFEMNIIEINGHNAKEIDVLVNLMYQQMIEINSEKDRTSIKSAINNALKPGSRAVFFLAKQNENPIGLAFINICCGIESGGDYIWINEIEILPQYRSKGFGTELLNHVVNWSKSKNIKSISSMTGIKNNVSQSMFASAGFEIEDVKWIEK